MILNKDFFWGGSVAANQYEGAWNIGGRGLTKSDVLTGGTVSSSRKLTYIYENGQTGEMNEEEKLPFGAHYYREKIVIILIMKLSTDMNVMRKIYDSWQKWDSKCSDFPSHGHAFSQQEKKMSLISKALIFITKFFNVAKNITLNHW